MKNTSRSTMLILLASLMSFYSCYATTLLQSAQVENKYTNNKFDSLTIEYWDVSTAIGYTITIVKNQIYISNDISGSNKEVSNADSVKKMREFIDILFISGKEQTEIGRIYRHLVFADYSSIEISIYFNRQLYVKHKIDLGMDNCDIKFSKTFKCFYEFLKTLCKQVE